MSGEKSDQSSFFYDSSEPKKREPEDASPRPAEMPMAPVGMIKPRLKHGTVSGHRAPSGSTIATPKPAPLPSRGSGVFLFLNVTSAAIAVIFAVLLAIKL